MKRFSMVLSRVLIALAILFSGAGFIKPVNTAKAGPPSPDALRTGDLPDYWRQVDTLGLTGSPYPQDIQGSRLNRPAGIFIDDTGKIVLTEENGKRVWGFAGVNFSDPITTPTKSGVNDPFWSPRDVTRNHELTWVIDGFHLAVLDNAGAIVQNFYDFDNPDPALGWVPNKFNCAESLSFDAPTDLLYVVQNCGDNPVLVLRVETPSTGGYFPNSLTLVDAFSQGKWYKRHIQTADLNNDAAGEVYISGDDGIVQCEQPAVMPGDWTCNSFASSSMQRVRGLTYSADEHALYAIDTVDWDWGKNGIRKCDYDGNCADVVTNNDLSNTPNLTLDDPQDLALAASGDIYITDASRSVVARLSFSGGLSYVPVFGELDEPYITADGYLYNPTSVMTDADNNLYIAENNGRRILSFDVAGTQRWVWGQAGKWNGNQSTEICSPQGNMALDPAGHLYIADRCSGRLVILNKDTGAYLGSFSPNNGKDNTYGFNGPAGVAISSSGRLFVSDPDNQRVQEFKYTPYIGWSYFSTIGIPISWPDPGTQDGVLMDPSGLALKSDNEAYIADRNYSRVQKCTRPSNTSTTWTCVNLVGMPNVWGNSNYLLNSPEGLALDSAGRLFVADNNNNRVQVFDTVDGTYLASIGMGDSGTENDQLSNPTGVALDSAGNVYVADSNSHRVQKFVPTVPPLEYVYQQGGQSFVSYKSGGYLFNGYGNRVYVYDITTDPANPEKIGQSQALPGDIRDIVAAGNYAYILTSFGGLDVLDISTPAAPLFVRESLVLGDGQALALDETASNIYVLQNGPTVLTKFSLANPEVPVYDSMHWLNGWANDVVVRGGRAYVAISNGPSMVLSLDALNLSDPTETKELDTAKTAGLALDGATLYVADPGYGLYQLDTTGTDPLNSLAMAPTPTTIYLQGEYGFAYTTNYNEIAAIHISGTVMTEAGTLSISPWRERFNSLQVGSDSTGAPLIYLPSTQGLATYLADTTSLPLSFTLSSQEAPDFSTGWQTQTIGNTLYSIDLGIFKIFDITDPTAPVLINSLVHPDTGFSPFVVRQEGVQRILYILAWDNGKDIRPELRTYNITDPTNLVLLASTYLQMGNNLLAVNVVGAKVIAAVSAVGYWDGKVDPNVWHPGLLELFDVTDPTTITALPAVETFNGYPYDIDIRDNYLFVAEQNNPSQSPDKLNWNDGGGGGGLRVYDINGALDPTTPTPPEEKAVFGSKYAQYIDIEGNTVFESVQGEGVSALTIDPAADPSTWTYQSIFWLPYNASEIQVASRDGKTYAWVANDSWIRVLDVTDPTPGQVSELAAYRMPFYAGISMSENIPLLWLSGYNEGMSAWWAAPTMDGTVSTPDTTLTSSLDDVSYTFADENLRLWHTPVFQGNMPPAPKDVFGINRAFETTAFDPQTELPVSLADPYTLTVGYDPAQLGIVDEDSLKLYFWNGTAWVVEPSTLNLTTHTLTAHPNHFSDWSVMGAKDTGRVYLYLPSVVR
jgi:hypothetical protein